jgi:polysaccharide biosynthesis protein PslH
MGDILFLAHRLPYPPDRGDRIRSFHLLKALARLGRVHLAAFADNRADLAHLEALRPLIARSHVEVRRRSSVSAGVLALTTGRPVSLMSFYSGSMHAAVAAMLAEEPIDTIFAFSGQMAQLVPPDLNSRRFIMDFVDVDSAKFEAYADKSGLPMRWVYAREGRLLAKHELQTAARADLSLFTSEAEADLFRQRSGLPGAHVAALENGIDLDFFRPDAGFEPLPKSGGPLILFTGQMDYLPNVGAVTAFASRSMPIIRAAIPDARFAIVGRDPTRAVKRLAGPGVIVTGEVPDVRPWLAAADVGVAPLVVARGVQNKVLEAMAMARPVVASPAAFAGIEARPDRDLIVAGPGDDARAILSLLRDPAMAAAQSLGRSARLCVETHYGWENRLAPLARMIGRGSGRIAA